MSASACDRFRESDRRPDGGLGVSVRIVTARSTVPVRNRTGLARLPQERSALLSGVSIAVMAAMAPLSSARAQSNPFGAQWYGQTQAVGRAATTNPTTTITPEQQRQVNVSIANVQRAADALRTARVEQATAQSAARAASAIRTDGRIVANGIARGGLYYARGSVNGDSYDVTTAEARAGTAANGLVWQGANLPTQRSGVDVVAGPNGTLTTTSAAGRELVTVQQTASLSILTWQNFDIGSSTTLYLQQTGADGTPQRGWTSLNRVVVGAPGASGARVLPSDPRLAQSLILGKIRSEGQVYVINQNGILFGAGSDVNTNTLVASSLDIGLPYQTLAERNQYFLSNTSGRTNFSFQYLFEEDADRIRNFGRLKQTFVQTGSRSVSIDGRPVDALQYAATLVEDQVQGDVTVEKGAQIVTSPLDSNGNPTGLSNNDSNIGRIVLAAPHVTNDGNLRADDGQIALLGTRNFSIYANDGRSGVAADPNVRGAQYQIGQQDLRAINSLIAGARPSNYINSSLAETIFGNAPEGGTVPNFPDQNPIFAPARVIGVAQGGANYDPTKTGENGLQIYTDQRRPYVVQRTFANTAGLATASVGSVTNNGIVDTPRGGIVVRAGDIVQSGLVTATTSVNQAGSIDFRADNATSVTQTLTPIGFLNTTSNRLGTVSFATGSITSILADAQVQADGTRKTIPSDALSLANFKRSQIRVATYNGALLSDTSSTATGTRVYSLAQARNFGIETTTATPGQVLTAGAVALASGSLVLAPSGNIQLAAAAPLQTTVSDAQDLNPSVYTIPTNFTAGLTIGTDGVTGERAIIDAAGLADVVLPVSSNVITVARVGQNELADSPTQRNGFLFRQRNILVDRRLSGVRADGTVWQGTPLFDATGYINARGQLVTELMTSGGTIDLSGAVAVGNNATLNVAGGLLTYAAGNVATTALVTADGKRTVDIGRASVDDQYSGIAGSTTQTNSRFSQSVTYNNLGLASGAGTFEDSYFEGGSGGTITFSGVPQQATVTLSPPLVQPVASGASLLAFEGQINAGAVTGVYQHVGSLYYNAAKGLPKGGTLDLSGLAANSVTIAAAADLAIKRAATPSAFLPSIVTPTTVLPSALFLNQYWSTESLQNAGLASITFGNDGVGSPILGQLATRAITFGRDANSLATDLTPFSGIASLALPDGGKLTLNAQSIDIGGTITAHSGSLNFNLLSGRYANGQFLTPTPLAALLPRSTFMLRAGSILDVSGQFVNDTSASRDAFLGYGYVNGGSVSIGGSAYLQTVTLAAGSTIDLSSGGYVTPTGRLGTTGGNGVGRGKGGDLTLAIADPARRSFVTLDPSADPKLGYAGSLDNVRERIDTQLTLGSTIRDFGFQGGGTFKLVAPSVSIGPGGLGGTGGDIRLNPEFFTDHGFGAFDLTGVLTASVEPDVQLTLSQKQFLPGASLVSARTLADASVLGQWAADSVQRTPVNFRLAGLGLTDSTTRAIQGSTSGGTPIPQFLSSSYTADRALTVSAGASILGDAGASIALAATGQLRIGDPVSAKPTLIRAQGGTIAITQNFGVVQTDGGLIATYSDDSQATGVQVSFNTGLIASGTTLDASGVFLRNALVPDYTTGTLLTGGQVSFGTTGPDRPTGSAGFYGGSRGVLGGALLVQSGATVNISGATASIQTPTAGLVRSYTARDIGSDAGRLTLAATDFIGKINARGGGASAGGTLAIAAEALAPTTSLNIDAVRALSIPTVFGGAKQTVIGTLTSGVVDGSGIDSIVFNAIGDPVALRGGVSSRSDGLLLQGGVNLSVGRSIVFNTINPTYDRSGGTALNGDVAQLSAPYVRFAQVSAAVGVIPVTVQAETVAASNARLVVAAETIDVVGANVARGFGTTTLTSTNDIRFLPSRVLGSGAYGYNAGFAATGDLTLIAGQIYPSTGVNALIRAGQASGTTLADSGTITIRGNGTAAATPLSVGGSLTLSARTIDQGGVLRAPGGTITLGLSNLFPTIGVPVFTQSVTARAGSVTSVSLDGLTVPYGQTINGTSWRYSNLSGGDLSAPPAKAFNIVANSAVLEGASADKPAALIDLSGGGDIYATEFVPGLGGQRDVLQTSLSTVPSNPVYAIVPGAQPLVSPVDPQGYSNLVPDLPGRTVTLLADAGGLKAGTYTLYPGYYATLPGAYRIEAVPGLIDLANSETIALVDGSVIAAGLTGYAGTSVQSSRTAAFRVSAPAVWKQYSQIDVTSGNSFFAGLAAKAGVAAPRLPVDAGRLSLAIAATDQALRTAADIRFGTGTGGRGGQVDIASRKIAVVSDALLPTYGATLQQTLVLTPRQLAAFGASSILLGGTRTTDFVGDHVDVLATDIRVATSAADPLVVPELVLVTGGGGTDPTFSDYNPATSISVLAGSVIRASGTTSGIAPAIALGRADSQPGVLDGQSGDGGFLRVSVNNLVALTRLNPYATPAGTVNVASTAATPTVIDGGQALQLDGTAGVNFDLTARLGGRNIGLASNRINLSNAAGQPGTTISAATLQLLANAQTLSIVGRNRLTLDAPLSIAASAGSPRLGSLTIDTPTIVATGLNGGTFMLDATNVILTNSGVSATLPSLAASGTFNVTSDALTLTGHDRTVQGFDRFAFTATKALTLGDAALFGTLQLPGSLTVSTPQVLLAGGSDQRIVTTAATTFTVAAGQSTLPAPGDAISGKFALDAAGDVTLGTAFSARNGDLSFRSRTGSLTLTDSAVIDARGFTQTFIDKDVVLGGGKVGLFADIGNGVVAPGARVDVSADPRGNAGSIEIVTGGAQSQFAITRGFKGAANGTGLGGSLVLDSAGSVDLEPLAQTLMAGGFTNQIAIASGVGNLDLTATSLTARSVSLEANDRGTGAGLVTVATTIDASGPQGGTISLTGQQGVALASSARLIARATQAAVDGKGGRGGSVTIATGVATPDTLVQAAGGSIQLAAGAQIDVSDAAGYSPAQSSSGASVHIRAPIIAGSVDVALGASVTGARSYVLEGYRRFTTQNSAFDGIIDPAGWFAYNVATGKADYVRGTWRDPYGGIVQPGDPQNGIANPTNFTEASYFDPSYYDARGNLIQNANQAHVNFYQNTLVNFVQNPGVSLSGFAGAAGLVFRPGIELVNSDPTRLGGDVQVLSNWNPGAGSSANSLFYRTANGAQPGLLTVRAAGDVIVKASISDGFFRTSPVSEYQDFTYANALQVSEQNPYGSSGLGRPRTLAQLGLGASDPLTPAANQYYRLYDYFALRLRALQSQYVNNIGPGSQPYRLEPTTNYINVDPGQNYSAYSVQYQSYLERVKAINQSIADSGGSKFVRPVNPVASVSDADYGSYGANYFAYADSILKGLSSLTGNFVPISPPTRPVGTLGSDPRLIAFNRSVANTIANNATAGDPNPVTGSQLNRSGSSWSYQFTAGAATGSANVARLAGRDSGAGNFALGSDVLTSATAAGSGNVIRTGAGEIGITARGNVSWANINDVVYTAGIDAGILPGFIDTGRVTSPTAGGLNAFLYGQTNTAGVFARSGGDIRVTALGTIAGARARGALVTPFRAPVIPTDPSDTGLGISNPNGPGSFFAPGGLGSGQLGPADIAWWLSNQGASGTSPGTDGPFGGSSQGLNTNLGTLTLPALQSAEWVTTGRISGSLAAVGGGNIDVRAGGAIDGLTVAVASTFEATGGKVGAGSATGIAPVAVARFGGGDIALRSGGDVRGLSLLNARGTTSINVSGSLSALTTVVEATDAEDNGNASSLVNYFSGDIFDPTLFPFQPFDTVNLIRPTTITATVTTTNRFKIENGEVNVAARGSIDIGALDNLAASNRLFDFPGVGDASPTTPVQTVPFSQLGTSSAAHFVAATGDVKITGLGVPIDGRATSNDPYSVIGSGILMPSSLLLASLRGNITINGNVGLASSPTGNLDLLAYGSIYSNSTTVGSARILMSDQAQSQIPTIGTPQVGINVPVLAATELHAPTARPLHADDAEPSRIIALTGDIATGQGLGSAPVPNFAPLSPNGTQTVLAEPATIFAGRDIVDMQFIGQNTSASSITSITAGRDITFTFLDSGLGQAGRPLGGSYTLGGEGRLALVAGRDLSLSPTVSASAARGIAAQDRGALTVGNEINPYLSRVGASIDVLFGVGPTVADPGSAAIARFVETYINPANARTLLTDYGPTLQKFVNDRLTKQAQERDPATAFVSALSVGDAYAAFAALPASDQRALVQSVFFNEIQIVADPGNGIQYQNFDRVYRAIDTLFPAARGYTDNLSTPVKIVRTGNFDMVSSLLRTSYGGDINILGPGGNATIGGLAIDSRPQGILTLRGGGINIFTDGNLAVNSSRVFTLQGGDETIFATNGNIDAGRGRRTAAFLPPLLVSYLPDATGVVNFGGLVTGAGIGTLQTLPSSVASDVFLLAPRGDIDAGDAGIRSSRNLFVVANRVFNADNIAVSGKTVGVPQAPTVSAGSVTTAGNVSATGQSAGGSTGPRKIDPQAIITVQVQGFAGDDDEAKRRKRDKR